MLKIEQIEKLDNALEKLINNEFSKNALQNDVVCNYAQLNFVAKENDELVGILSGWTVYSEFYISELIVLEGYREKGIGTQLIRQVEYYCKDKSLNNISLRTNGFQAKEFYEKCGFKLEFTRENKQNSKLTKYFFVKYF